MKDFYTNPREILPKFDEADPLWFLHVNINGY